MEWNNEPGKFELVKRMVICFRDQWDWIAKETLKRRRCVYKQEYFLEHNYYRPLNDCYLCECKMHGVYMNCFECPIEWDKFNGTCIELESPFWKWQTAVMNENWEAASKYAKDISELPLKYIYLKEFKDGKVDLEYLLENFGLSKADTIRYMDDINESGIFE